MKNLIFVLFLLAATNLTISAQSEATSSGAQIISGAFAFSSQGGDLHENFGGDRQSNFLFTPSYLRFVMDKLAIGGSFSLNRISQGDASFTIWGIGPKASYFFDTDANSIPYLGIGLGYRSIGSDGDNEGGFGYNIGGGFMLRKDHLGVTIEAGYQGESFKPAGASDNITGNTLYISVGFAALLY